MAMPLRVKARSVIRSGMIGLSVGVIVVAIGFSSPTGRQAGQRAEDTRVRTIVIGFIIAASGFVGLLKGLWTQVRAARTTSP
jgi:hypothetical protein